MDLELGDIIVRARELPGQRGRYEWSVYGNPTQRANEARSTLSLIQQSLELLKVFRNIRFKRTVDLKPDELAVLGVIVASFLLIDPVCHPGLSKLYDSNIVKHVMAMPDLLRGRLHLPTEEGKEKNA